MSKEQCFSWYGIIWTVTQAYSLFFLSNCYSPVIPHKMIFRMWHHLKSDPGLSTLCPLKQLFFCHPSQNDFHDMLSVEHCINPVNPTKMFSQAFPVSSHSILLFFYFVIYNFVFFLFCFLYEFPYCFIFVLKTVYNLFFLTWVNFLLFFPLSSLSFDLQ